MESVDDDEHSDDEDDNTTSDDDGDDDDGDIHTEQSCNEGDIQDMIFRISSWSVVHPPQN